MQQLNDYCSEEEVLPDKYQFLYEVFYGDNKTHTHGATTWESALLATMGIVYHDTTERASDLNSKFGKQNPPTRRLPDGCLFHREKHGSQTQH